MNQDANYLDRLGEMFELQEKLQRETYGRHPAAITDPEDRIQFIKDMILAAENELNEALDETGWKPWATSRHVNVEEFKGELIDVWHFFINLCLVVDMTPDELHSRYIEKRRRNQERQAKGYDGIIGKCHRCHRAFDDLAKAAGVEESEIIYATPSGATFCSECVPYITGL